MALTFLNVAFLGGLALASVPIAIHLLNRRRYLTVDWAAMQFLEKAFVQQSRRLKLEEVLVLLARTLAVILVALALARPFWGSLEASSGGKGGKCSAVILIDASYSMALGRRGSTCFDRAKDAALTIIGRMEKGDSVAILAMSDTVRPVFPEPIFDLDKAREAVSSIEMTAGSADLVKGLDEAIRWSAMARNPRRDIYVLTDMQARGWCADQVDRWRFLAEELKSAENRPGIWMLDLGEQERENLAVTDIAFSQQIVGTHRPVRIEPRISNFGAREVRGLGVHFFADSVKRGSTAIDVPSGQTVSVSFEHLFPDPGSHHVAVQIDPDLLETDNTRCYSVDVASNVPVLLVDGAPSIEPLRGEAGFLAEALAPRDREHTGMEHLLLPTVLPGDRIGQADLSSYRAVVLANVRSLSGRAITRLEQYVNMGGGILFTVGDKVNVDLFNRDLYRSGDGLAPARIEGLEGDASSRKTYAGIAAQSLEHAAVAFLAKEADFSATQVYRWCRMKSDPGDSVARVMARLDNGCPLLVGKRYGQGGTMVLATTIDADWNNMPFRPLYLPLVQRLVLELASTVVPPRNLAVGGHLVKFVDLKSSDAKVLLTDPTGRTIELPHFPKGERRVALFRATEAPGLYAVKATESGKTETTYYVVNPDPAESDLSPLGSGDWSRIQGLVGAERGSDVESLLRAAARARGGEELWAACLILAILMLFAEILLTRRFSHAEPEAASEAPAAQPAAAEAAKDEPVLSGEARR